MSGIESTQDLLLAGARRLLQDGLQMEPGSTLLILHQEELADLADFVAKTAVSSRIRVDQRRFRAAQFDGKYPPEYRPERLANASPVPQGIILLIEWSVQTTKGRLEFLRSLQSQKLTWRIASMPGVELKDLQLCGMPIQQIRNQCFLIFAALARAQCAFVHTRSPEGNEDVLVIPIGDYCPNISTGGIAEGTWGNFPSGETFVVPNKYASFGWMTLRGSFPKYVLSEEDWIRFEVYRGRVRFKSITASSDTVKNAFLKLFFRPSGRPLFPNANAIAELGVGANSAVTRLTGNPIFDEKRIGTIHLGLGSNHQFGGPIHAKAHNDITCSGASLGTPSVVIVEDGRLVVTKAEAVPSLRSASRLHGVRGSIFRRSGAIFEPKASEQELSLVYYPNRGGPISVHVDASGVMDIALWILNFMESRRTTTINSLMKELPGNFDRDTVQEVFRGLAEIGLLEVVRKRWNYFKN